MLVLHSPFCLTAAFLLWQVGRIRQSLVYGKKGLDLFVCGDQLLRGAASNAVFIAEAIIFPEKYEHPIHIYIVDITC